MSDDAFASLSLSPEGYVYFNREYQGNEQISPVETEKIEQLFAKSSPYGLLHLGLSDFKWSLPPSFQFWQIFSRQFIVRVCKLAVDHQKTITVSPPKSEKLQAIIERAPFIKGAEYFSEEILTFIWHQLEKTLQQELENFSGSIQAYLGQYNSRWNLIGRVCFHLAENKNNEQKPFAFLATYTTQLSHTSSAQHLPLKRALQESAIEKDTLLSLLVPVQKCAKQSSFIKSLVDTGAIFEACPCLKNPFFYPAYLYILHILSPCFSTISSFLYAKAPISRMNHKF